MKKKSKAVLSLLVAVCMLNGCAEKTVNDSVNIVDMGEVSFENFSSADNSRAVSFSVPQSTFTSSSSTSLSSSASSSAVSTPMSSASSEDEPSEIPFVPEDPVDNSSDYSEPDTESSVSSSENSTSSVESEPPASSIEENPENPIVPNVSPGTNSYQTLNYSEVKGIWISYLELAGLPSGSESEFRNAISKVYDNCVDLGVNTVFVHVRSHSDAYYTSAYYPRTKYLGGSYDPLNVMIEEAHSRNLSFQAWINPLRGCAVSDINRESGYPIYNWAGGGTKLVEVNGFYYLNPAYDDVIELIANGAAEIAANYDVDGVHIDDYFYPTTDESFDYQAYRASSYTSLSDFRFANCDKLVSKMYSAVKSANNNALFGVSPQGNFQNNYYYMYADVEKWCTQKGYLDYIMPQVYFGFKNSAQPFADVVKKWDGIASKGRIPLIVGLACSKLGSEDVWGGADGKYEWVEDKTILARQFLESRESKSYGGICLYSYKSLFNPDIDIKSQVNEEVSALKAALK